MKITRAYVATKAEVDPMMKAAGLSRDHVKCGDVASQHISAPDWRMREGELLAVFDLTAFGDKHPAMAAGVAYVQSFGADVCEIGTGAIARGGVGMTSRALAKARMQARGMTPEKYAAMARCSHANRRAGWMDEVEARAIWGNRVKYTERQALLAMTGWPRSTAFYVFGNRKDCEAALMKERNDARPKRAVKKSKTKRK